MSKNRMAQADKTPLGGLEEARLHFVLGYQLAQAAIVTDQVYQDQAGGPFEVRPVEYTVLTLIHENPGGSLARLAKALAVKAPNITVMVDRLEARGLIRRTQSDEDRRSQVLHTTRKGADLVKRATEAIITAEKAVVQLTPGEYTLLVELLHKVACARTSGTGKPTPP